MANSGPITAVRRKKAPKAERRPYAIRAGSHYPPGATVDANGVNFSIFARDAVAAELRVYASAESPEPMQVIDLNVDEHRTFYFWHVYIAGLKAGAYYTWRVASADQNLSSTPELFDPWGRAASTVCWDRRARVSGSADRGIRAIVTEANVASKPMRPLQL